LGGAGGGKDLPSGDGMPGGVFSMRLNAVPGDVTRDGRVTGVDMLRVRASLRGAGALAY
jgi:hypothetical protein